jgi:hypothetical protein
MYMQQSDLILQHPYKTLATYVYSYYNICNIPIYFCNIDIQHLQRISETSETLEIYSCNIRFQRSIFLLLDELTLVDAELYARVELDAAE